MTHTWQPLHFVPELGVPSRYLIGVLVRSGEALIWLRAPLPPLHGYLSPAKLDMLEIVLDTLSSAPDAALPHVPFTSGDAEPRHSGFGHHFLIGAPQQIPSETGDALGWVSRFRLPHPMGRSDEGISLREG